MLGENSSFQPSKKMDSKTDNAEMPIFYKPNMTVDRLITEMGTPLLFGATFMLFGGGLLTLDELWMGLGVIIVGLLFLIQIARSYVWRCWFDDYQIVVEKMFTSESYDVSELKRIWASVEPKKSNRKEMVWCTHFEFDGSNFLSIEGDERESIELAEKLNKIYFPIIEEKGPL